MVICEFLFIHLSNKKYNVTVVRNGKEAFTLLVGGLQYDVVIMDIMMPVWSGIEAVEAASLLTEINEKIVFFTGGDVPKDICDKYPVIYKPFTAEDIIREIQIVLRRKKRKEETNYMKAVKDFSNFIESFKEEHHEL